MKLIDREKVAGTNVTIGRRVANGKPYSTYSAEFTDVNGKRVYRALKTRNKQAARRKALEIQTRLDEGRSEQRFKPITIARLIDEFMAFSETKGLAPKSIAKYRADLDKLQTYCAEHGIFDAGQFDERCYYDYRTWLKNQKHKQGVQYAEKSLYTALTITKQLFKWAHRHKILPTNELVGAELPTARAKPQPCPTTEQVEAIIEHIDGAYADAVALLAYTGMRVGELIALRWEDVLLDRGDLGMIHIRLGGAHGLPKDKESRRVPLHSRVRPIFERLPRTSERVIPGLRDRTLLAKLKRAAKEAGITTGMKTHSLRHFFASMVANSSVPYRMAMAWMGHSSSSILDLYYHLHDGESEVAMNSVIQLTM